MDDSRIIELFFERDEQAIAETQRKYGRLCQKIAGGILMRPEDAEEAISTSYMKLWNAIPPKRPESLCGYICMIVRNTALNLYDSVKRRSSVEIYGELEDVIPDRQTSVDFIDDNELAGYLNDFLHKLKPKNRDIFTGRYYFNLSLKEIADRMGMTETAVKTRLCRTRADLKEYLIKNGIDPDK